MKKVKGREYIYFTYYNPTDHKKTEIYCGLASKSESKQQALELEINYLKDQEKILLERLGKALSELKQIK